MPREITQKPSVPKVLLWNIVFGQHPSDLDATKDEYNLLMKLSPLQVVDAEDGVPTLEEKVIKVLEATAS